MTGSYRLPAGGQIDRACSIPFLFDGKRMHGYAGDTLASALLGNGVSVVGRSLKFHRPRGILSAGPEEPNALVTVGDGGFREPNVRATLQPLTAGLVVRSQNCWPSISFDLGRLNDVLHPLFPAGFYNKTFMWPGWHAFEPAIRRMAGLGTAADGHDPDSYTWRNGHCDVLIVGGGIAGMLAASLAAQSGARVMLLEQDARLGGRLNWQQGQPFQRDAEDLARGLQNAAGCRVLLNTTAVGMYDHGVLTAVERAVGADTGGWRKRWWRIRATRIVIACGAIEQPLAFPFNDLPGTMLADAIRHYALRFGVAAGRRIVLATNNDSAYVVARDLRSCGINVSDLLDTRTDVPDEQASLTAACGVEIHRAASIRRSHGARRISAVEVESRAASGNIRVFTLDCDALGVSGGWSPVAHLYCQAGGKLRWDGRDACLVPDGRLEGVIAVGAAAGLFGIRKALEHASSEVGRQLQLLGHRVSDVAPFWRDVEPRRSMPTGRLGYGGTIKRARTWLDLQHDVTVADIDLAVRENLVSIEHVKRYTTVGMSVDQGKTSNLNAIAVLAERSGREIAEVGVTTFRPMFVPVTLGAIAGGRSGDFYRPRRELSAHDQHVMLGAVLEDYASWQRPACYPRPDESWSTTIHREVASVRSTVGLFDASPLGKLLVRGADAPLLLDRLYANTMSSLRPGQVRYGLMLNEQGIIIDDGVCARLGAEEFLINTSSAGATRIAAWIEEWLQCEWPDLKVVMTDVTSSWATFNLAGPRSRDLLQCLPCDINLERDAFPHMQARTGTLCGIACRVLRVSFTGELSYEVSVSADAAGELFERLLETGRRFDLVPFGIEALGVLRTEKGYIHVGSDTDGTTIPDDVGLGAAVARKQTDFIGRRSLHLPESLRHDRLQLVGLRCTGDPQPFVAGAHLLDEPLRATPAPSAGYLTSASFSPFLGRHVGLGLLRNGRALLGRTVQVVDCGRTGLAEVVEPVHYDPTGERLRA